jgi:hypothetical protein
MILHYFPKYTLSMCLVGSIRNWWGWYSPCETSTGLQVPVRLQVQRRAGLDFRLPVLDQLDPFAHLPTPLQRRLAAEPAGDLLALGRAAVDLEQAVGADRQDVEVFAHYARAGCTRAWGCAGRPFRW